MKNCSPQEIITLAASITFNLTKGKSIDEINAIKNLIGNIYSNLNTYVSQYHIHTKQTETEKTSTIKKNNS